MNPLSSFIPAIDSNTANATKYMKSTRIAGVFMQSLSHSVNKTSKVPGYYKCPIEKLSELRHFHRHTILSNQLTVPPNFIAFYVKLACGILLVKDTWRRGVQVSAGKGGRKEGRAPAVCYTRCLLTSLRGATGPDLLLAWLFWRSWLLQNGKWTGYKHF